MYFDLAAVDGLPNSIFREDFSLLINAPENIKNMFLQRVSDLYGDAYALKKRVNIEGINPKRSMDALLRIFLRGDLIIQDDIAKGASPLTAYQKYMKAIGGLTAGSEFTPPPVEDVMAVATQLQQSIIKMDPKLKKSLKESLSYAIVGSFPNGLSKKGASDVDVSPNDMEHDHSTIIQGSLDRAAGQMHWADIPMYGSTQGMPLESFALLNPVMIQVTEDSIALLVWKLPLRTEPNPINGEISVVFPDPPFQSYFLQQGPPSN